MTSPLSLQDVIDIQSRRFLGLLGADFAIHSLTTAVNPDGSSANLSFQAKWVSSPGTPYTVTLSLTVTP